MIMRFSPASTCAGPVVLIQPDVRRLVERAELVVDGVDNPPSLRSAAPTDRRGPGRRPPAGRRPSPSSSSHATAWGRSTERRPDASARALLVSRHRGRRLRQRDLRQPHRWTRAGGAGCGAGEVAQAGKAPARAACCTGGGEAGSSTVIPKSVASLARWRRPWPTARKCPSMRRCADTALRARNPRCCTRGIEPRRLGAALRVQHAHEQAGHLTQRAVGGGRDHHGPISAPLRTPSRARPCRPRPFPPCATAMRRLVVEHEVVVSPHLAGRRQQQS